MLLNSIQRALSRTIPQFHQPISNCSTSMNKIVMVDLSKWAGCLPPQRKVMEGRYVRLEPLDSEKHSEALYKAHSGPGSEEKMLYLWEPTQSEEEFQKWIEKNENLEDPIFFTLIDKGSGLAGGRQAFLRINAEHGTVELGHILWGPLVARKRAATEAVYLFACHVFDELGYRRFEWKCHNENYPSKKAAVRFGFAFEGIFRNHFVMKGRNRDTAWFAMIDSDWPMLKTAYEKWLDPVNFDEKGMQIKRLEDFKFQPNTVDGFSRGKW